MKCEREVWSRDYLVRVTAYRIEKQPEPIDVPPKKSDFWDDQMAEFLEDYDA